jgi:hypothetical protein
MARRYRCLGDYLRRAVGPDRFLVRQPFGEGAAVLCGAEGQRLVACSAFATLDEHAARLAAFGVGVDAARRELDQRVADGLLVESAELLERVRGGGSDARGASVTMIGIPTRGRAESLAKCVASHRRHLATFGRHTRFVICHHGERTPPNADDESHIGRRERIAYADAVAASGVADREILRWALAPEPSLHSAGASRNTLLLQALGSGLVMVDDDTAAPFGDASSSDRLAVASVADPTEHWFADADRELPAFVDVEQDVLTWHERLLGKQVGALVDDADISLLDGNFARRCARGARVRTTQLGLRGDTGTGTLGHYLELRGSSRERLVASESGYAEAWRSRRMVRAVTQPTIAHTAGLMGYALGVDARAMVAPFPPILRNADGVFGAVMRACFRDYASGLLPVVVAHLPPEARHGSLDRLLETLARPGANDRLSQLIPILAHPAPRDPQSAMRHLGRALVSLVDGGDWAHELMTRVARSRAGDIARLNETLILHDHEPTWWAQDVQRTVVALEASAVGREPLESGDLGSAALGEYLRRYGRLLAVWPDVVEAAGELAKQRDLRPSSVLTESDTEACR